MNQFIGFCVLLGGLFGVATMLLWRLPWPKREPWRTSLEGLIVIFDLLVALWLNRHFSQHSYELIATTVACSHFAFVCFWCVTSRGTAVLRIGLFGVVVAAMFALFFVPPQYFVPQDELGRDWDAIQTLTQRLIITCVATSIVGIFCRVNGWRLELTDTVGFTEKQFVEAKQTLPAVAGLIFTIPVVIGIHWFVESNWTNTFNRDFSIAALGCFYGALMLCILAITACRFIQFGTKSPPSLAHCSLLGCSIRSTTSDTIRSRRRVTARRNGDNTRGGSCWERCGGG